jgi:nicotinamidase-related amidase
LIFRVVSQTCRSLTRRRANRITNTINAIDAGGADSQKTSIVNTNPRSTAACRAAPIPRITTASVWDKDCGTRVRCTMTKMAIPAANAIITNGSAASGINRAKPARMAEPSIASPSV